MGGRIGYSAATGVMVILLSWFGIISLMTALIPVVAISPILLYIGMLIGSQAFQESPKRHAPAIVVALVPSLAAWGKLHDRQLPWARCRHPRHHPGHDRRHGADGRALSRPAILGGGSILAGVVLGAIATYIIDRQFLKAAGFAFAGAVLTFFGLMHGEAIGIEVTPSVSVAYIMVACVLFGCGQFAHAPAPAGEVEHEPAHDVAEFDAEPAV